MRGATQNNLKDIDVTMPLGLLVCVTGVSGSGKSTLVHEVLYNGLHKARGGAVGMPGACRAIEGGDLVDEGHGRSVTHWAHAACQSCDLRQSLRPYPTPVCRYARCPGAGLWRQHVLLQYPGGRCETCQGSGFEKVEMQFLSDIFVACPECEGARFRHEVLEVRYRGCTITDVLQQTVTEALAFFNDTLAIRQALRPLQEVGLDYIRLGQPEHPLRGRITAAEAGVTPERVAGGRHLFIFDEPTTGLHFEDIHTLMRALQRLLEQGHSLLVIEHNMEVIKSADYLIDLGPEGGEAGGSVIACGTPEEVSQCAASYTGQFLRHYLYQAATDVYQLAHPQAPALPVATNNHAIAISGARHHNLKNIEVHIPGTSSL